MKKIIISLSVALTFLLSSCGGGGNGNPTPTQNYFAVPYWTNDTMIGLTNGLQRDTMIAISANNKSYISYKGIQYEVKAYGYNGGGADSTKSNFQCDIFDINGAILPNSSKTVIAGGVKYYHTGQAKWVTQYQTITVNSLPFWDQVVGGYYSTLYK